MGDTFTLNGDSYHIIANSPTSDDYVVALKEVPLKATDITAAGGTVGYTYSDTNQTGGMAYHTSSSTYVTSDIKSVVDSWATSKFTNSELKTVDGYSARLIKYDEYSAMGDNQEICTGSCYNAFVPNYNWMYNNDYWYWTMTPWQDGDQPSSSDVWNVFDNGDLGNNYVNDSNGAGRPVINVYKSKISS